MSSYQSRDVPFPGYTPSQSSANSPAASKVLDSRPLPKPRPLFVYDELPKLAKKDIVAFNTFVEGVTLLAWDIAWLCRTQGLGGKEGFQSWTDICAVGRNLWILLVADRKAANSRRGSTSRQSEGVANPKPAITEAKSTAVPGLFGQYSHGTAHSFFGGAEGAQIMGDWRTSPTRTIDKVKGHLLAEMQGAEWEVVHEKEWDGDSDLAADEPVIVGGSGWTSTARQARVKSPKNSSLNAGKPSVTSRTLEQSHEGSARGQGNGWMKVRQRNNSAGNEGVQK
jgi:Vacuolar sorting 38 and autophagy-related subunit 14